MIGAAAFGLAKPLLFRLDPETAHGLTIGALERGLHPRCAGPDAPELATDLMGLRLPNPVGVAAGFDKDGRVPDAMLSIGFGMTEIGTVTPLPQPGNPLPRLFRLPADGAVINRFGFNSAGHAAVAARLSARRPRGCVGINIGANKDSADRVADYVRGVATFADRASYLMANVSSPNTPGLRDLQAPGAIAGLLRAVNAERDRVAQSIGRRVPVAIKIAPDFDEATLSDVVSAVMETGVDAIAVSNTTVARPNWLTSDAALTRETGGLSGLPLFHRSTVMLAKVRKLTAGAVPLIGIGGIGSGEAALAKIEAGATAVQLYTGLVYGGPPLLMAIKSTLARAVRHRGARSVAELVGTAVDRWADMPLEDRRSPFA